MHKRKIITRTLSWNDPLKPIIHWGYLQLYSQGIHQQWRTVSELKKILRMKKGWIHCNGRVFRGCNIQASHHCVSQVCLFCCKSLMNEPLWIYLDFKYYWMKRERGEYWGFLLLYFQFSSIRWTMNKMTESKLTHA